MSYVSILTPSVIGSVKKTYWLEISRQKLYKIAQLNPIFRRRGKSGVLGNPGCCRLQKILRRMSNNAEKQTKKSWWSWWSSESEADQ